MAKANTRKWESGFFYSAGQCRDCGKEKKEGFDEEVYRLYYYPTFMNGDAELENELCKECFKKQGLRIGLAT